MSGMGWGVRAKGSVGDGFGYHGLTGKGSKSEVTGETKTFVLCLQHQGLSAE